MRHITPLGIITTAAAALAIAAVASPPALACGGFFCSQSAPVNQVAERILFTVVGTTVEAHIQIGYEGPAEDFSWVLPMPEAPQIGVGTDELFRELHEKTDPQFLIDWQNEAGCQGYRSNCPCAALEAALGVVPSDDGSSTQTSVEVLAVGQVGPYDYHVVESGDGQDLFDWLTDNGYDVPTTAKGLITHYADIDFVFLALKLAKDTEVGEIQPIVLSYTSEMLACIPLQLTAIAAQTDMPVYTWVLAEARAVPLNFFHVVLDEGAIDWLNCAADKDDEYCEERVQSTECRQAYMDTVTSAANSAAGHGFVTEFAGTTERMKDTLYWEGRFDTEALKQYGDCEGYCANPKLCGPDVPVDFRQGDTLCGPGAFLFAMNEQRYPATPLLQELIRTFIPKPPEDTLPDECKTDAGFYGLETIDSCLAYMDPSWTFDAEGFADELYTRFAHPMQQAQGLFDTHGYMTRLFTTVSPADMDRDPLFSFNPDLPDVSNVHEVTATATCKAGSDSQAETIVVTYPSGAQGTFEGDFDNCGGVAFLADPPNDVTTVAEIQVLGEQGEPQLVPLEAVEETDDLLDSLFPTHGQSTVTRNPDRNTGGVGNTGTLGTSRADVQPVDPTVPSNTSQAQASSGGCQGGSPLGDLAMWLSLIGLIVMGCRRDPDGQHLQ